MLSKSFIGGVIAGAAGLATAAFIDHKITESRFSPELKTPDALDKSQVVRELNNYFFKAQAIISKCNEIVIRSSDHIVTPMPLPWDNLLQKAANAVGAPLTTICRKGNLGQLLNCRKEAEDLYGRYHGVFVRANTLLTDAGLAAPAISKKLFAGEADTVNSSLENESWIDEFDKLADSIRDTIDQSCEAAQQMIESLEQEKPDCVMEAAAN